MTRFPPLSPSPMLITAYVLLWDEGLHTHCNICVNHSLMSEQIEKGKDFHQQRAAICCVLLCLSGLWWWIQRSGEQTKWKEVGGVQNKAFFLNRNVKNPSCFVNLHFPQNTLKGCLLWRMGQVWKSNREGNKMEMGNQDLHKVLRTNF